MVYLSTYTWLIFIVNVGKYTIWLISIFSNHLKQI